jgi:ArsR family transcriptional regulator
MNVLGRRIVGRVHIYAYGHPWTGFRGLTGTPLFDSYQTMYAERGGPGQLAPGQFERIAKALADPRRFSLLKTIAEAPQECAFQKLCSVFPVTKATISHHMKELATAGLVETERDGQFMHARLVPGVIEAYTAELQRRIGGATGGGATGGDA